MGHGNLAPMVDFEHKSGYQSHSFPIITKKGKGSLLGRVGKWGGGVPSGKRCFSLWLCVDVRGRKTRLVPQHKAKFRAVLKWGRVHHE